MVDSITPTFKEQAHFRLNGLLTLPHPDTSLGPKGTIFAPLSIVSDLARSIEQVGSAYEKLKVKVAKQVLKQEEADKRRKANPTQVESSSDSSEESEDEVKGAAEEGEQKKGEWEKKRHKRTKEDIEREVLLMGDLYAILGLEHMTYEAGESDIKSAYKKLALMCHPDKLGENITENDKEIWLKIQNAYETLVDPVKRKRYDSSLPFNDSIP
jgi:DnaJ domain